LHRAEEVAAALSNELGAVPGLQTQVSSFAERIVHLEDHQLDIDGRFTDAVRQHQLEIDYIRSQANDLVKRVENWDRLTANWQPRFDALEEGGRRSQEASTVVRQRVEDFERFIEIVDQRAARTADGLKRYEQDLARLSVELETLYRQDATLSEHMQVYGEFIRRIEDELGAVAQQADVRREFNEKLDLQRSGVRRAEERLNALEAAEHGVSDRLEEHERVLTSLDNRERTYRERVTALQEEIAAYRTHVGEQFQKLQATFERHRRRRIEEIEREIRELKVNGYRPQDE
jgi:chromosome segregation ATPase